MATKNLVYDHPAYLARYSSALNLPAVAASTPAGKFIAFAATRVKSISCNINIAGTNAAAGYDILNGTTSIGEFVLGSAAATTGVTQVLPSAANGLLAAGGYLEFKTKANSGTMATSLMVEYELGAYAEITV